MILNFISGPRNISTAMMYSFAQRKDTVVVDEPFYAFYLLNNEVNHPGKDEIIKSMEGDPVKVIAQLNGLKECHLKEILFIKNMAHHLTLMPLNFLKKWQQVFLIRDPYQVLASYSQVIDQPNMLDIGIQRQFEIWDWLQKEGHQPLIIDSEVVLKDPEKSLTMLCERLDIPFQKSMLSWNPGPKKEDGIWAKFWYKNVHQSSEFKKKISNNFLPLHLESLYKEADIYYKKLKIHSLNI
jgi:hypothetical protein